MAMLYSFCNYLDSAGHIDFFFDVGKGIPSVILYGGGDATITGWWFQIFLSFCPTTWGDDII